MMIKKERKRKERKIMKERRCERVLMMKKRERL